MKLSEAIMLGSTHVRPLWGEVFANTEPLAGCALGMGLYASGYRPDFKGDRWFEQAAFDRWPWLWDRNTHQSPCGCESAGHFCAGQLVQHLFDGHIMSHQKPAWTLEKLVDWIRSVEPSEPVSTQTEGRDPECSQTAEMECRK